MEFRKNLGGSYILDEQGLKKIVEICNDIIKFNATKNQTICVSISYKEGLSYTNISLEEANTYFADIYSDIIDSITFTVGGYSDAMRYSLEFHEYGIRLSLTSEDVSKLTHIKSETMNLCENMRSPIWYRFLGFEKFLYIPILYFVLFGFIKFVEKSNAFTDAQKVFSMIVYVSIIVFTFFSNKIFPKARILLGKNIIVEKKLEKFRLAIWTYLLYPVITFLIGKFSS